MKGETACRIPTKENPLGLECYGFFIERYGWKDVVKQQQTLLALLWGQLFWPSLAFLPFASFVPERAVSCVVHVFLCFLFREWKDREESGWI